MNIRRRSPFGSRAPLPWPEVEIVHSYSSSKARPLSAPSKCSGNRRRIKKRECCCGVWFGCVSLLIRGCLGRPGMFYDATETEKQAFKLNSPATSTHVEQHKNHVNRRSAQWQVDGNLPGVWRFSIMRVRVEELADTHNRRYSRIANVGFPAFGPALSRFRRTRRPSRHLGRVQHLEGYPCSNLGGRTGR